MKFVVLFIPNEKQIAAALPAREKIAVWREREQEGKATEDQVETATWRFLWAATADPRSWCDSQSIKFSFGFGDADWVFFFNFGRRIDATRFAANWSNPSAITISKD